MNNSYAHGRRNRGGQGGQCPPHKKWWGGNTCILSPPTKKPSGDISSGKKGSKIFFHLRRAFFNHTFFGDLFIFLLYLSLNFPEHFCWVKINKISPLIRISKRTFFWIYLLRQNEALLIYNRHLFFQSPFFTIFSRIKKCPLGRGKKKILPPPVGGAKKNFSRANCLILPPHSQKRSGATAEFYYNTRIS